MADPIQLPLSATGDPTAFAAALSARAAALAAQRKGKAGIPAPVGSPLLDALIQCVPAAGPVATRGPDTFQVAPYEIVDDTPKSPEVAAALSVLRETLAP